MTFFRSPRFFPLVVSFPNSLPPFPPEYLSKTPSKPMPGVTAGGIVGHAICTGAAVLGGRHAAAHIDERTVHLVGGVLFLAFGAHAAWTGVEE